MGRRALRLALALTVALVAAGCGDDIVGPNPEDVTFDASLGIDLGAMTKLADGVYVQTVTPGTGTATVVAADVVSVDHRGWLPDGTLFSEGAITDHAVTGFVPGFTEGLIGMKVGEVRRIVIPAALGYGDQPPPRSAIPDDAVLVFLVTLVSIS
jgi:FKBP-type peptidyl-prolyl cis-trans isomerase